MDFSKNSRSNFDPSFIENRNDGDRWFTVQAVGLDTAGAVIRIADGSAVGKNELWGALVANGVFKIDVGESAIEDADVITQNIDFGTSEQDATDRIVLSGDVTKIIAKIVGQDTLLYKNAEGANNVLAVIESFQATDDSTKIEDDFLRQTDQTYTLDVI